MIFFFLPLSILALDIDRWNLECEFNNTDHRTNLNGIDRLIVRRGQPFSISLYLRSGSYQPGVSSLDCVAETGTAPDSYIIIFILSVLVHIRALL